MADVFTPEQRASIMRRVKSQGTSAELEVQRVVRLLGFRYQLNRHNLPGVPDLIFSSRRKVIFVHGCFWHGHKCPRGNRLPKSNRDYWLAKITRNKARDNVNRKLLRKQGWKAMIVWECKIKNKPVLLKNIARFLLNI
jgi:DNA mismatch endonuclease (patch repair protein)